MFNYTDISLTEIPNCVSLVLYSPGCTCTCPWCFNGGLLDKSPLTFKQMKDAIDEHCDFVDGLVFSGGEPLLNPFLKKGIQYAKSKGLKIKINTNGLVPDFISKNMFLPYVDYMNISIKGTWAIYDNIIQSQKCSSAVPHCDVLEYSFVYAPAIWPNVYLDIFHAFLKDHISFDWRTLFSHIWSQPDILTVSQIQIGNCFDDTYNSCRVPTEKECINVAKMFADIPKKQLVVETKEYGRKNININNI